MRCMIIGVSLATLLAGATPVAAQSRAPRATPTSPPAAQPAPQPPIAFLATTISEIGRPYTVIDTACVFQAFPKTVTAGDPLEDAMAQAFGRVRKIAADAGANGLIGYDIDFASPSGKEPGRLLLCGTLVKIR